MPLAAAAACPTLLPLVRLLLPGVSHASACWRPHVRMLDGEELHTDHPERRWCLDHRPHSGRRWQQWHQKLPITLTFQL
eukprot:1160919-Pelagomonas_calceolata.AAC.8